MITVERAAVLRERLDRAGFRAYDIADRGRYEVNTTERDTALFELLAARAQVTGQPIDVRWSRCRHGDYELPKGDLRTRPAIAEWVEVTLDFSAGSTEYGQIVWLEDGQATVAPQKAGAATVMRRTSAGSRYERYLGIHVGDKVLYRLRLSFAPITR